MPRKPKPANKKVNAMWPIIQLAGGLPDDDAARQRIKASMRRMVNARRQMERRAGPLYDLAVQRGRVISAAYRAMGSPPKPPFSEFRISETGALLRDETPEWRAWRAWLQERTRLQRELGMRRWKLREIGS